MRKSDRFSNWVKDNTNQHLCECGCGEYVDSTRDRYYSKDPRWFVNHHHNRGKNHPHYGDGVIEAKGYVWILLHGHPRTTPRGYVKRCQLVMEKKLGRFLQPWELVHHKDENKMNDDPDNLVLIDRVNHGKIHNSGKKNYCYRDDIDTEEDILPLREQGLSLEKIAIRLHCSKALIVRRLRKRSKDVLTSLTESTPM